MIKIRTAFVSDAKKISDLAERTFIDSFSEQNAEEDIKIHCQSSYGEAIQFDEISNPNYETIVAELDDHFVAYAQLRWGNQPSCVSAKSAGEIQRLYVDKAWHGKGVAQDMMSACLKILDERNTDIVWLGVWEKNPRAITFYKKFSFLEVGDHKFTLGKDTQRDIVMVRRVKSS